MPKLISLPEDLQGVTRFNVKISEVEPVNDLFSKCSVKILYPGLNANDVYIEKETANEMAETLYNIPIVGEYIETVEDFKDHGGKIEITTDDVKFIQTTKPYGFVPEGTTIGWQNVIEEDGTSREYLTCTAYLWTGRYPEAGRVIQEGRPQSMELDEDSLEGYWKQEQGRTIFHITKAQFSALCILGQDVPPAFESAHIGTYYVSNPISFRKRFGKLVREFEETVPNITEQKVVNFSSAKDDKETKNDKGGQNMYMNFVLNLEADNIRHQAYNLLNSNVNDDGQVMFDYSVATTTTDNVIYVDNGSGQPYIRDYTKVDTGGIEWVTEPQEVTIGIVDETIATEFEALKEKHEALEKEYAEFKEKSADNEELAKLQEENKQLKEFKESIETKEKEQIIKDFSALLNEEDIKPFQESIEKYTKDELESKLAVMAIRKTDFTKRNPKDDLIPGDDDIVDDGVTGWEKIVQKHNK